VELTTDQKGAIAESAIVHAAIKLGIGVYKPLSDGERYDLVFDVRTRLLRVQCKWAPRIGNVVVVRCYSARRARDGLRRRLYESSEVDLIAAYCPHLERCFAVSAERFHGHPEVHIRVAPSRNNQQRGVNWADDFAFDARLTALLGP
jgi:hypothetical protein